MAPHLPFPIADASQVGEARRAAARLAAGLGFDETAAGRLALVVTELGTNLLKHARDGRLLIAAGEDGAAGIEVLSLDLGPGMADVSACQRDGYSTAGSPGTGLGAIKRLADRFSMFSSPGQGTVILARVTAGAAPMKPAQPPAFEVGAVALCAPGETVCGDGWRFRMHDSRGDLLVADGLGHGPSAAEAAHAALSLFDAQTAHAPLPSPARWLEHAHAALRSTRGAAVSVASIDAGNATVTYSGAGNIAARLVSGIEDRSLMSYHGTVGAQMRHVQDVVYPWPPHAALVLHSDGLSARWQLPAEGGLLACDVSVIAGWLLAQHSRGRDDATVVVVRRSLAA